VAGRVRADSAVQGDELRSRPRPGALVLEEFLDAKLAQVAVHGLPGEASLALRNFLAAHGGRPPPSTVIQVAASLGLFHAFALVHDDVMDGSDICRGRPTVHRALGLDEDMIDARRRKVIGLLYKDHALAPVAVAHRRQMAETASRRST
jgi:hypothetical protein